MESNVSAKINLEVSVEMSNFNIVTDNYIVPNNNRILCYRNECFYEITKHRKINIRVALEELDE